MKTKQLFITAVISATSLVNFGQGNNNGNGQGNGNTHWKMNGNITSGSEFIGTTNNKEVTFKSNNAEVLNLKPDQSTNLKGDLYLEKYSNPNLLPGEFNLMGSDGDGNVHPINDADARDFFLERDCYSSGSNYVPAWANKVGTNLGVLYTGTQCPTAVGIGLDNPGEIFQIRGSMGFRSVGNPADDTNSDLRIGATSHFDNGQITKYGWVQSKTNSGILSLNPTGGNVGIGMINPKNKLVVYNGSGSRSSIQISHVSAGLDFNAGVEIRSEGNELKVVNHEGGIIRFKTGMNGGVPVIQDRMIITESGAVGIGTTNIPAGYKLAVNGNVVCEKVLVDLHANWPDYVFSDDYNLTPLCDLEEYITEHHHLPGIEKAETMHQKGIDLGEMNRQLVEKVEELTLYVIDLQKQITGLSE